MDTIPKERRSWNMSQIRGKDTSPERKVRSALHRLGFRFRLHRRDLPGNPDILMPRHRTVVFVHGCFWHRHARCKYAYTPKSRVGFWTNKFHQNVSRDRRVVRRLRKLGWRVIVVWECQTNNGEALTGLLRKKVKRIRPDRIARTDRGRGTVPSRLPSRESGRTPSAAS